jgi:hypothetical protein
MCTETHKRWTCGCTAYIETTSHCAILIADSCAFHSIKEYMDQVGLCRKCLMEAETLLREAKARNKKGSERERKKVQFDLNDFGFGKCKRVNSDWRGNGS